MNFTLVPVLALRILHNREASYGSYKRDCEREKEKKEKLAPNESKNKRNKSPSPQLCEKTG